jgi:peptidoglycan/LPS O-acetylase OafA/YrhL
MKGQRIPALSSLRFMAALFIVFDHATDDQHGWFREIPYYQGVTFFFVLSGFVLTYTYPQLPEKRDVLNFWLARFARVWPAYFLSLIWAIVLVPGWLTIVATPYGAFRAVIATLTLQSWIPQMDYYFFPNASCWSLSVEMFFYLLFPFLLREFKANLRWKFFLFCIPAVLVVVAATASNLPVYAKSTTEIDMDGLVYVFPVTRLPEFMMGMIAATLFLRRPTDNLLRRPTENRLTLAAATLMEATIVIVILAQLLVGYTWYESGPLSHVFAPSVCLWIERSGSAPLYALLLSVMARERGLVSRLLCFRPLVSGDKITYALYLLHQPFIWWLRAHGDLFAFIPSFLRAPLFALTILAISYIVCIAIEQPVRRRIVRFFHVDKTTTLTPALAH